MTDKIQMDDARRLRQGSHQLNQEGLAANVDITVGKEGKTLLYLRLNRK